MKKTRENDSNLFVRSLINHGENYIDTLDIATISRESFKIMKDLLTNRIDIEKHVNTFLNHTILDTMILSFQERYIEKYVYLCSMNHVVNFNSPFANDPHFKNGFNKVSRQVEMYQMIIDTLQNIKHYNNVSFFRNLAVNLNSKGLIELLKNEPIYM